MDMLSEILQTLPQPFKQGIERLSTRVSADIFGGEDFRSTIVLIYNYSDLTLVPMWNQFDSGGFGKYVPQAISPYSMGGYKVVSHGAGTGVTGAYVGFASDADREHVYLKVTTSNPAVGSNDATAEAFGGLITGTPLVEQGNNNRAHVRVDQ